VACHRQGGFYQRPELVAERGEWFGGRDRTIAISWPYLYLRYYAFD